MRLWLVVALVCWGAALGACSNGSPENSAASPISADKDAEEPSPTAPAATSSPAAQPTDYSNAAHWLCHPDKVDDLCEVPRRAQVLGHDLVGWEIHSLALPSPALDCFYVYPTVSSDTGLNSDLEPGAAERNVIVAQAAPFASACRVFAPVYRQLTLTALGAGKFGDAEGARIAYSDVVAAWNYYLEHENGDRSVVVIGHSQGASVLKRLLQEHVDANPGVRERLAGAFLLGTAVSVPTGKDSGGDFKNIPACRTPSDRGCVVSYASFNEAAPPPPLTSLFGRAAGVGNEALCVNPAELTPASGGELFTMIPVSGFRLSTRTGEAAEVTTDADYVAYDGLVSAWCVREGGFSYLAVTLNSEGQAWGISLPPYITGPNWGLHNLDVSLAVGNLVALVGSWGK